MTSCIPLTALGSGVRCMQAGLPVVGELQPLVRECDSFPAHPINCHVSRLGCRPYLLNTVMPGWSCSGMRAPGGSWKMPIVMVGSSWISKYVTVPLCDTQQSTQHTAYMSNALITAVVVQWCLLPIWWCACPRAPVCACFCFPQLLEYE